MQTTVSASINHINLPIFSTENITYTPYQNFQYLNKQLLKMKEQLFRQGFIHDDLELLQPGNSFPYVSKEEAVLLKTLVNEIIDTNVKIQSFTEWQRKVIRAGVITQEELDKRKEFIRNQSDFQLQKYLSGIYEEVINTNIKVTNALGMMNNSADTDEIINELFRMGYTDLLNTNEYYRKQTAGEIIAATFNTELELEKYIAEKVSQYKNYLNSVTELEETEKILAVMKAMDAKILLQLSDEEQQALANQILQREEPFNSYFHLVDYITEFTKANGNEKAVYTSTLNKDELV